MSATEQQRIETLGALLAAKPPLASLAAVLASHEWDSPPLVVLRREHVVAVGHSCRSQVKRFAGFVPRHPAEALRDMLAEQAPVLAQAAE